MKKIERILILLLAALVCLTLCTAAFAADSAGSGEGSDGEGSTVTTGETEVQPTENPYSIGLFVTDGEGNRINDYGAMSCVGGNVNLYIKNEYLLNAKYYYGNEIIDTEDQLILGVEGGEEYVTLEGNTIRLAPAPEPYTFKVKIVDKTKESGESDFSIGIRRFKVDLPDLLVGFIGIYVLVNAIRGKGSLFSDEFILEDKKAKFKTIMRILSAVTAAAFIAAAVIGICYSYTPWSTLVRYICFGVGVAALIAMIVVNAKLTDKEKRHKARQTALSGGPSNSAAAFEFDEDEPTIDDVLAEREREENAENKD
jgi:hypothetical protein